MFSRRKGEHDVSTYCDRACGFHSYRSAGHCGRSPTNRVRRYSDNPSFGYCTYVAASPCATITTSSGLRAFRIDSQKSDASYEAHFLVEGQTVPGTVMGITGDVSGEFLLTSDNHPTITALKIVIDLRTLDSGSSDRDDHVRSDRL